MTHPCTAGALPETSPVPVLALRGIQIIYPRPEEEPLMIVDRLDVDVPPGSMHVLAGRSGSGKTSVLRVAAGLVTPTDGEIAWQGRVVSGLPDDEITLLRRQLLGYLDQAGALLPGLTAVENVLLPAVPDRRARHLAQRAVRLLEQLGVGPRGHHYPESLSGGERQRVALARALLREPVALLADEPTAGLDRASADVVIELIRELAEDGVAVLVASHDPHLIDAGDRVTHLD